MQDDGTPALMRLAVVERQLIMQGLDLSSLASVASTCKQLRGEALHPASGKFISSVFPKWLAYLDENEDAHASPLFRKHAPMCLNLSAFTSAAVQSLLSKAARFSRVTTLLLGHSKLWTEHQMLGLLSLPCMQHAERVGQIQSMWLESPRVQWALLSLPQLKSLDVTAGPSSKLVPNAIALASKLNEVSVHVTADPPASVRSLRALRVSPVLVKLGFVCFRSIPFESVLPELIRCLPPTLTHLTVNRLDIIAAAASGDLQTPRPLVKALFSRTPLLELLEFRGSVGTILRGLLDAGLHALPVLRRVESFHLLPVHFSFDQDSDPIPPLLRRFLHRFPQVTVRFLIVGPAFHDRQRLSLMCYAGWPRVELFCVEAHRRIGGPPNPHSSDDEDGSDVEEWLDPLASEADSSS